MIKTFYQEDIIYRLAAVITYGLNNDYSDKSIEESIVSSHFVNALENNEYDIESKPESIVKETYNLTINNVLVDVSFKGLFFAETYFKLFTHFNRSFEYIFLYWPLSLFTQKYNIYHEMDFSSIREDFKSEVKKTTLLRKLASERNLKLVEIAKLTGINKNSIDRYSVDDYFLDVASYSNIYKLAMLFNVKTNIFAPNLAVYLDRSINLSDKRNVDYRNFLGLYFATYFDRRIDEKDAIYDCKNNWFILNNGLRLIVVSDAIDNLTIKELEKQSNPMTYLVIIPSFFYKDETFLRELECLDAFDIFVLTQEYAYIIKQKAKKEILDTMNRMLNIRVEEKITKLIR